MKEFIDSNFFNNVFDSLSHLYEHKAIVRRIQKEYEKLKILTKRRYIQLKIKINDKTIKTLLNNENKINFINRIMIKQLSLFLFFINEKICNIINTKLKIFEVYFLTVAIIDKNNNQRFFEIFFLKISINENLIFGMLWLKLAISKVK